MAEYTNITVQSVQPNQDVLYDNTAVRGNCSMFHREGSGLVNLRNTGNQCRALFEVLFSGNVALATGATVEPTSLAIAVDGEALGASIGTATPAAAGDFFNVSMTAHVYVPKCCCQAISVMNIGTQAVDVQNANLTISRIA